MKEAVLQVIVLYCVKIVHILNLRFRQLWGLHIETKTGWLGNMLCACIVQVCSRCCNHIYIQCVISKKISVYFKTKQGKNLPQYTYPSENFLYSWYWLRLRLRVVPHFSSGIVERAKRERAWKSPHARKGDTRGERKMHDFSLSPPRDSAIDYLR